MTASLSGSENIRLSAGLPYLFRSTSEVPSIYHDREVLSRLPVQRHRDEHLCQKPPRVVSQHSTPLARAQTAQYKTLLVAPSFPLKEFCCGSGSSSFVKYSFPQQAREEPREGHECLRAGRTGRRHSSHSDRRSSGEPTTRAATFKLASSFDS